MRNPHLLAVPTQTRQAGARPPHRLIGWLCAAAMAASFAPAQARADISQELKDEVNAAEVELRGLEKDKATPVADLIGVHGRLGRLCKQANWPKKAQEHWKKLGELFAKAKLVKNGGTEATWAAEALYNLLDERAAAAMLSQPTLGKPAKKPDPKAGATWQAALQTWGRSLAGTTKAGDSERLPGREGGLAGELQAVAEFRSPTWAVAAAVLQTRLVGHVAAQLEEAQAPAAVPAEQAQAALQENRKLAGELTAEASALIQAAWAEIDRRNLSGEWRSAAKRELNRYLPRDHPLSRMRAKAFLTPIAETLQKEVEQAGLLDDIHACYDRHLALLPDEMLGEVNATWLLLPEGTAELRAVDHADPRIGLCLKKRWAGRTELPHDAAPVEIRVRLEFAAL